MKRTTALYLALSLSLTIVSGVLPVNAGMHGCGNPCHSQVNLSLLHGNYDGFFINWMKAGQVWSNADNSGNFDPTNLDSNGYPITLKNNGPYTTIGHPTAAQFASLNPSRGNHFAVIWTGAGSVQIRTGHSTSSGSSSVSPQVIAPSATLTQMDVNISAVPVSNLAIVWVDNCTTPPLTGCGDYDDYIAGKIVRQAFKDTIHHAKIGALRFLNYEGDSTGTGADAINVVKWGDQKPAGYVYYEGVEMRASVFAGTTTHSGTNYSITCRSGSDCFGVVALTDKMRIQVLIDATGGFSGNTLNVNGIGAVPIAQLNGNTTLADTFHGGVIGDLVYDSTLNLWLLYGANAISSGQGNGGINSGVPPEVIIQACQEIQIDCWYVDGVLDSDPRSNYIPQLLAYASRNLTTARIKIEGPNEQWGGQQNAVLSQRKGVAYWGPNIPPGTAQDRWMGMAMSTLGQAAAAVYGKNSPRYEIIAGFNTNGGFGSAQRERLNSATWVASGPDNPGYIRDPAYNWVNAIAFANYWNSTNAFTGIETTNAFNYFGNVSLQAGLIAAFEAQVPGNLQSENVNFSINEVAYAAGFAVVPKVVQYEGGYSDDVIHNSASNAKTPTITGAVNNGDGTTTLTIGTDSVRGGQWDLMANQQVTFASASGGTWSTIVGNTYTVSSANQASHTAIINLDSSALGTFTTATITVTFKMTITNVTKANPCVVTVASNLVPGTATAPYQSGQGFTMGISGIVGMTQLNGFFLPTLSVSGNDFTMDFDCSGFSAYVSGGTITFSSESAANGWRISKKYANLGPPTAKAFAAMADAGMRNPSIFQFGASGQVWPVFNPNWTAVPSPEWNGVAQYNGGTYP